MDKSAFKEHTRYTITWRTADGKARPADIYVYKLHDDFMIARLTQKNGYLYKIAYADVLKIVKEIAVPAQNQFHIPGPVLDAKTWKDRTEMARYSSAPHMGK